MRNRLKALALYRQRVGKQKLIEGWIEGPCAQAANLRGISRLMLDFFEDPQLYAGFPSSSWPWSFASPRPRLRKGPNWWASGMLPRLWSVQASMNNSCGPTRKNGWMTCMPWDAGPAPHLWKHPADTRRHESTEVRYC